MEHKSAAFELKQAPDSEGRFEGYASVFGNVDRGLDIVMPGAFTKSLQGRKPKMLWQHDTREVIGSWEEVREDNHGLFVKGRVFPDLMRGKEAITLLREGELDSMSIGYRTVEATEEGRSRKLNEVELFEVSLVTFPMNEDAKVTAVKADNISTEREFELFLRDAGFSRKEAKAITAEGFRAVQRDAGDGGESDALKRDVLLKLTNLKEAFNA